MRARAVVLTTALLAMLPGLGLADHFDSDAGTGAFSPLFTASVAPPLTDRTSDVTIRLTQEDHEEPAIKGLFQIPGDWQFGSTFSELRAGQRGDGSPATSCGQTIDGRNDNTRSNAFFARAERIGTSFLSAHADGLSRSGAAGARANPTDQPLTFNGHHAFLSWNASTQTAKLCLLLTTSDPRITGIPDPNPDPNKDDIEGITEIVADYEMVRTADGGVTTWDVVADLTDLAKDSTLQTLNASLIEFRNTYKGTSAGNWGAAPLPVSKNPTEPGTQTFKASFWTCPPNDPAYGACKSGHGSGPSGPPAVVRTVPVDIALATGGVHPLVTFTAPVPFSVLTAENSVPVRWQENLQYETPKGYVLRVSRPGETDPTRIYQVRKVQGESGYWCNSERVCTTAVSFPLSTGLGDVLPMDEKYEIAVVSIFKDGHRSDGRCDDGTAPGSSFKCTAALSHQPGRATVEVFLTETPWALRFQDPDTKDLILLSPPNLGAEYVYWIPGSFARRYPVTNARVDGTTEGTFSGRAYGYSIGGAFSQSAATGFLSVESRGVILPRAPVKLPSPVPTTPENVMLPIEIPQPRAMVGYPV